MTVDRLKLYEQSIERCEESEALLGEAGQTVDRSRIIKQEIFQRRIEQQLRRRWLSVD